MTVDTVLSRTEHDLLCHAIFAMNVVIMEGIVKSKRKNRHMLAQLKYKGKINQRTDLLINSSL